MGFEKIRQDTIWRGIVIGIIFPFVVLAIQYMWKNYQSGWSWDSYWYYLKTEKRFLTGVSTICLIANGFLFGILIQFKKFETARGVFIPTVLMSIAVLLYKLL
jgi:hypothetical protein